MTRPRVYVGMSGGVDSSVAAALLLDQDYDVTGVYMKNWSRDLPGMQCPWAEDLADAKRVAVQLGIDFKVFDFETQYRQKVVDYMLDEYRAGRTPNPDIMCNQEVKFKLFLETSLAAVADYIATGHYARVQNTGSASDSSEKNLGWLQRVSDSSSGLAEQASATLLRACDDNKDQTYFLYRVTAEALARTMFPLGDLTKPEVRQIAKDRGLWTARKKESMGVCFVGNVGMREFLSQYITTRPGDIIDKESGRVLGRHDGAIFYTLGQRHGLDVGGGLPYYVVGKNMDKNEVYVSRNINDEHMWRTEIKLTDIHWINQPLTEGVRIQVRLRHRGALINAIYSADTLHLESAERAVAPGQSAVIYRGEECLGGGIMSDI